MAAANSIRVFENLSYTPLALFLATRYWLLRLLGLITVTPIADGWRDGLSTDPGKTAITFHVGSQLWITTEHSVDKVKSGSNSTVFGKDYTVSTHCKSADYAELTTSIYPNVHAFTPDPTAVIVDQEVLSFVGWHVSDYHESKVTVLDASRWPIKVEAEKYSQPPKDGDSGGPVFKGGMVVGIIKGSLGYSGMPTVFEVERPAC